METGKEFGLQLHGEAHKYVPFFLSLYPTLLQGFATFAVYFEFWQDRIKQLENWTVGSVLCSSILTSEARYNWSSKFCLNRPFNNVADQLETFSVSLWRRANAWNVRLYYPYWQDTNILYFDLYFNSVYLRNTLRLL